MPKYTEWMSLLFLSAMLFGLALFYPSLISDDNAFLRDFFDIDFLSVLSFITSVTLASVAQAHLHLNNLSDKTKVTFSVTRDRLLRSAISLISAFVIAIILTATKPPLLECPDCKYCSAFANSIGILILMFDVMILYDITIAIFRIPTQIAVEEYLGDDDNSP